MTPTVMAQRNQVMKEGDRYDSSFDTDTQVNRLKTARGHLDGILRWWLPRPTAPT